MIIALKILMQAFRSPAKYLTETVTKSCDAMSNARAWLLSVQINHVRILIGEAHFGLRRISEH